MNNWLRASVNGQARKAFTLTELLVVIAVIAILAAFLFRELQLPEKGQQMVCVNNLHQISLGVLMYSADSNDAAPNATGTNIESLFSGYKQLMKSYVGLKGASSPQDKLFACPADKFYPDYVMGGTNFNFVNQSLHDQSVFDYSSYVFNGGDNKSRASVTGAWTPSGLTGLKLSAIKHPDRTLLVMEASALAPWSWHDPASRGDALPYDDAKSMVGFADGHASYVKIYWNTNRFTNGGITFAFTYDPPPGYNYQWSAN